MLWIALKDDLDVVQSAVDEVDIVPQMAHQHGAAGLAERVLLFFCLFEYVQERGQTMEALEIPEKDWEMYRAALA